jgi:hypothetical protein
MDQLTLAVVVVELVSQSHLVQSMLPLVEQVEEEKGLEMSHLLHLLQ